MGSDGDVLRTRAAELGVETSYWDVGGRHHDAPESTLRAVVDVLEADAHTARQRHIEPVIIAPRRHVDIGGLVDVHLVLADGTAVPLEPAAGQVLLPPDLPIGCHELRGASGGAEESGTVVVAPDRMPRDDGLAGGSGLFVPTYALWERSDPLPSFAHLAALAGRARQLGMDVVATLPLYAAFLDDPFDPSPYSPVSRLHWNEVYLDDSVLADPVLPGGRPVDILAGGLVDWRALARRRRHQLLAEASDLDPYMERGVDAFLAARPDVADYARFRTGVGEPGDAGHPAALVERSHALAQYLAHRQLSAVEGPRRAILGLDLPIGSHPAGYETWAYGQLFAPGMAVGAPPDEFFDEGQNWGFPPQLPATGRADGHRLWRQLVARAGEYASMLRIDHVMGVQRLWWIPEGAGAHEGVYVRYPREELLAVIAAEAHRTSTTIVGENLGTVSDEVRAALDGWDVLGLYEEQFNLYDRHDGPLGPVPARSVAGIRTHDMPAFAAAFTGDATGGVYRYRKRVETAIGRPVGHGVGDVYDAALTRLTRSDAYLVLADLDDLVGETAPHNVPGQILETTWRRRLRQPWPEILAEPDVRRRLRLLTARGGPS